MKFEINLMDSPPEEKAWNSKLDSHKRDLIGDDVLDDFLNESDFTTTKKKKNLPIDIFELPEDRLTIF